MFHFLVYPFTGTSSVCVCVCVCVSVCAFKNVNVCVCVFECQRLNTALSYPHVFSCSLHV